MAMVHIPSIPNMPDGTRKTIWHLQNMKDRGEVITQISPSIHDPLFAQCADMAGVDILRYSTPAESAQQFGENVGWWTRYTRSFAPHIHMNCLVPTHFYCDGPTAVRECSKLIHDGADSILPIGITNEVLKAMSDNSIPVFGHVGILSFWQVTNIGGFRRVGKTADEAYKIYRQAFEYQENGMKAMTIEMTPSEVSEMIAKKLKVPVINIAGSNACNGSEAVMFDTLKMMPEEYMASHAAIYGDFFGHVSGAFKAFADDVRSGAYPQEKHCWHMEPAELDKFITMVERER